MIRNALRWATIFVLMPALCFAQAQSAPRTLSLTEAEAIALKNNPQITIGKLRALVAQQIVRESRSALLPNASLSVTAADSNPGSRLAAGFLNNPVLFPRAAERRQRQPVDHRLRPHNQFALEFGISSQGRGSKCGRHQGGYSPGCGSGVLQLPGHQGSRHRRRRNGKCPPDARRQSAGLDECQAQIGDRPQLFECRTRPRQAASAGSTKQLPNFSATLSAILGYADQQNFQLVEDAKPVTAPAPDVAPLIQQALQQRPELKALQFEVASAQKFGNAEHDLWRPTVNALGVVGEAPVRDDHIPNWYGAVGVNINIPVFNGFLYNARAKAADLQTEVDRQRLLDTRNNIASDVRNAWQNSQSGLPAAFRNRATPRASQPRFRFGSVPVQSGSRFHRRIHSG